MDVWLVWQMVESINGLVKISGAKHFGKTIGADVVFDVVFIKITDEDGVGLTDFIDVCMGGIGVYFGSYWVKIVLFDEAIDNAIRQQNFVTKFSKLLSDFVNFVRKTEATAKTNFFHGFSNYC